MFSLFVGLKELQGIGVKRTASGDLVPAAKFIIVPEIPDAVRPFGEKHRLPLWNLRQVVNRLVTSKAGIP